jgi:hypothetical protein
VVTKVSKISRETGPTCGGAVDVVHRYHDVLAPWHGVPACTACRAGGDGEEGKDGGGGSQHARHDSLRRKQPLAPSRARPTSSNFVSSLHARQYIAVPPRTAAHPPGSSSSTMARRSSTGGWGYRRIDSLMQRMQYLRAW